jgi:cytochrome c553
MAKPVISMRWIATLFPLRLTQWIGPFLLAGAIGGLLASLVLVTGVVNLAASTPHPEGWARLLHYAFQRSTAHHAADITAPADLANTALIAKGAGYYGTTCAHCHGGPGLGQNPIALSMRPRPQYLVREVGTFSAPELFWIVKHGVKYSGMPAYPAQDRDDEIWSIVSFLRALPKMTTAQYRALAYGDALKPSDSVGVGPLGDTFLKRSYSFAHSDEWPLESSYTHPAIGFDAFSIDGDVIKTCSRCHTDGGTGRDGGAIPNIAILRPEYIRKALTDFASGKRHSGFMQPVATQLDDRQIGQLASYYSAQPHHRSDSAKASADMLMRGRQIATVGIPARGLGGCAGCHDITKASAKAFPMIDGQHRVYLADRLRQFRTRPEKVGGNPMIAITHRLGDGEIDAVAAYYAARLPGAARPIPKEQ